MQLIDISLPIHPGMIIWPRDAGVTIEPVRRIAEGANANTSSLSFGSHTGTHVDAPRHFIEGAAGIDEVPLDVFFGPARVVEIEPEGTAITAGDFERAGVAGAERVLVKTRNSGLWEKGSFDEGFAGIDAEGGRWLVAHGVRLVALDYLSIAPYGNSRPTHLELLGNGCIIVEGVDLRGVEPGDYTLCCFPLRIRGGDGAPARAVLIRG